MFHRGWFQIAVRDPRLSERVSTLLGMYGTARLHVSVEDWPVLSDTRRFAGVVAEHRPGFAAWVRDLRARCPTIPVLALVAESSPALLSQLQAQSVEVAALPLYAPALVAFVQRAVASDFLPHERVARMVQYLASARGLSAREVQLLSYCLGDEPRARVRRRLGISENTLKTQIKSLLRKCGERNVDALAKNLLRAALLAEGAHKHDEALARWHPALRGAA